jgi:hypothetical protein
MTMDTTLRKDIMRFLTPLTCMQSEESRRAALYAAGLDAVSSQTNLSGSSTNAVAAIVQGLEQYGTVGDTPALVVFLRYVATTIGGNKQQQIQDFCERLRHNTTPSPQQTSLQGQRHGDQFHSGGGPMNIAKDQARATQITTPGDYFESVGGQAQVFTGPVNIYQGAPPQPPQGASPGEPATVKNRTGQEQPASVQEDHDNELKKGTDEERQRMKESNG